MRIAVCDDEKQYRNQAEFAIRECLKGLDYGVVTFAKGAELLQSFSKKPFDLIFLDIEMPEMDGISVARQLRQRSKDVSIVFLTSHIEYALDGYEVSALRYLTKPISIPKLQEVLSYIQRQLQEQRVLWVKTDLCDKKLKLRDIVYMEAQNQNILICTKDDSYSVRYNMSDYETELQADDFIRIHRSYLVALRYIKSIGKGEVILEDGTSLPVSRSKEKALKEALFQFIRREAI